LRRAAHQKAATTAPEKIIPPVIPAAPHAQKAMAVSPLLPRANQSLQVGDQFPDFPLSKIDTTGKREKISLRNELLGDLVVVFTVPKNDPMNASGAQLQSYLQNAPYFKRMGVLKVACLAPFSFESMHEWQKKHDPQQNIQMLPSSIFDFGFVAERAVYVLSKGVIIHAIYEPNPLTHTTTSAHCLIDYIAETAPTIYAKEPHIGVLSVSNTCVGKSTLAGLLTKFPLTASITLSDCHITSDCLQAVGTRSVAVTMKQCVVDGETKDT
ncbi:MAG TPA: hypothetical protein VN457_05470, partial [Chlamydiales bacterium]|nr:hypothetical protein [Chlamydiales bacterium]